MMSCRSLWRNLSVADAGASDMTHQRRLQDLSLSELREQVALCHEHFRRCMAALHGEDVEPVELFCDDSLGDSDDLELFYECKTMGGRADEQEQ